MATCNICGKDLSPNDKQYKSIGTSVRLCSYCNTRYLLYKKIKNIEKEEELKNESENDN